MKLTKYLNIAAKLLLVALFVHYLTYSEWLQYQNKGMHYRLIFYTLMALTVFIVYSWVTRGAKKKLPYPHLADFLITLAFAGDMLGNTLNLFDRVEWWDDLMHFVLWALWVMAIAVLLRMYTGLSKLVIFSLALGFGAATNILWELSEYSTFVTNNPSESLGAYRDTMGDELLSLLGSVAGSLVIVYSYRKQKA